MQKKIIIEKKLGIPPDYQYKALKSKNFIHSNWHKNKLETLSLCVKLKKTDSLLDLGIGSGNLEFYLNKKVKKILGMDYNEEAVNFARKHLKSDGVKNVKVFKGDIKNLTRLKIGKFDLVVMVDVIEHFKFSDAKKIVRGMRKFLKKNGKVCIVTPNFDSTWVVIEWFLDKLHLAPELGGKQHLSRFNPEILKNLFEESGYRIEKIATFNTFSYLTPIDKFRKIINKWEVENLKNGNMLLILSSASRK